MTIVITVGQRGDSPQFTAVLGGSAVPRLGEGRRTKIRADNAYSSRANRGHLCRRGIKATIPINADRAANHLFAYCAPQNRSQIATTIPLPAYNTLEWRAHGLGG
ncbi:hypothetical protein [Nocardia sp. CDC160]|uniref:hypothetical protein n=1 Tax=Nocardia sp. CDC160 TaxID=3112166 RepID=UPI002DC01BBE|nr:hypothetical protein [Nocardia sp. CDC160]MEC3919230.1 hypothetical protein [Nocardia sp. CDC160]